MKRKDDQMLLSACNLNTLQIKILFMYTTLFFSREENYLDSKYNTQYKSGE